MANTAEVIERVVVERQNQDDKWGVQHHSLGGWLAILMEEVGEAATEVYNDMEQNNTPQENMRNLMIELVQVAAVAVAFVEAVDRDFVI